MIVVFFSLYSIMILVDYYECMFSPLKTAWKHGGHRHVAVEEKKMIS